MARPVDEGGTYEVAVALAAAAAAVAAAAVGSVAAAAATGGKTVEAEVVLCISG